ncbi:MAG TPA: glycosyltransferase family 4 protein [Puia sp.]|nr:glycosyltransferase family 4 protein [Puia sp.]
MINDRKTLIILSPGFPANEEDSACLPAQQSFVRSLNKNFPDLKIIILAFEYPFVRSAYLWHNNSVISFAGKNRRKIFRLIMWRKIWQELKKINKQENIIGLLSFWCTETALVGKLFAKKFKLKHFCWVLGQDARKGNKMIRFIKPKSEELIAMSDSLATEFFLNYKIHPKYIIPNGINPELFSENNSEKDIEISAAGSLIPLKRYDIFIDIINEINKTIPSAKEILCGKGEEEKKIKLLIEKFNLQNNITLTGEISHAEVLKIMQRSKIFLHTSSYEGFSGACLEALYSGAHVISFCQPMKQEIGHWHIVKTKEEMFHKTLELLSDPSTDFSPVLPFTMDNAAREMMRLFV